MEFKIFKQKPCLYVIGRRFLYLVELKKILSCILVIWAVLKYSASTITNTYLGFFFFIDNIKNSFISVWENLVVICR